MYLTFLGAFFSPTSSDSPSQKSLSARIEAKVCHHLLDPSSHDPHRVAHLSLIRVPGVGAWLFALPDSLESHIPAPLFRVSRRRRLRMPFGLMTPTALFAARSWISGATMPLFAGAVVTM